MSSNLNTTAVKLFLESWGLHYDTYNNLSNDIPYPQIYERMQNDALETGGKKLSDFIGAITITMDGRTRLTLLDWAEIDELWEKFSK
jgi:hypothetical protein